MLTAHRFWVVPDAPGVQVFAPSTDTVTAPLEPTATAFWSVVADTPNSDGLPAAWVAHVVPPFAVVMIVPPAVPTQSCPAPNSPSAYTTLLVGGVFSTHVAPLLMVL